MRKAIVLVAVFALVGCGGDGRTTGPTGPQIPNISGSWTYNATNVSGTVQGIGVSCRFEDITLSINQTGTTFTGQTSGGAGTCSLGVLGDVGPDPLDPATIVSGQITGNSVTFDFETSDWRNTGTISGNSMSGTVTVRVDFGAGIGVLVLTGNWAAAR